MEKQALLYTGKAKSVYETEHEDYLVLHFRNDASAFNGEKIAQLERKGKVNNRFNTFIMQKLSEAGIETHFERQLSDDEVLVKRLKMIPVECVVRNYAAGGLMKRLGLTEGLPLLPPTFELFYKDDALGDPMLSESTAIALGYATADELEQMKVLTYKVNEVLGKIFDDAGLMLVDFKLEFGLFHGRVVLGDEFSPDGCRLWDKETKKKLDKDRFRQGLGDVVEGYEEVALRIGVPLES
ncbi:phosphoribosylaminoimidazolesuccinocarboxamide synthase [Moraxella sp. Tifton1]|uniref:phosphoribosylaminoimidazolesuccinocarboxamide synthase n=1 Tax=Moraxella oculi TaxID=2940516 RepID=UPI0020120D05|nr:phosphoribosylaminoimidazolesuccinocarboxamide synthase [Moraxella sp. Tifton1]MCL1624114.1 phosphoribosylaminoimidazolesuccinocarboxamide synthase [Moraxella sp. Tifton1]